MGILQIRFVPEKNKYSKSKNNSNHAKYKCRNSMSTTF